MSRVIRVTGKGLLSLKPDQIVLHITQSDVCKKYDETLEKSGKDKEIINNLFKEAGFNPKMLKTLSFNINPENEGYQDEKGIYRNKIVGYRYYHQMKIAFKNKKELLNKALTALSQDSSAPEFSIEYTVADKEKAKNQLLDKAVIDATEKANVLAKSANVILKEIVNIDYSFGNIDFVSPYSPRMNTLECKAAPMAISCDNEVEDIDVSDTVTITWEIE